MAVTGRRFGDMMTHEFPPFTDWPRHTPPPLHASGTYRIAGFAGSIAKRGSVKPKGAGPEGAGLACAWSWIDDQVPGSPFEVDL